MAGRTGEPTLRRKSFFVNPRLVRKARKVLRVGTEAEALRLSLERVTEIKEFWRFMARTRRSLNAGSLERP